jgi:hypothetical protein
MIDTRTVAHGSAVSLGVLTLAHGLQSRLPEAR